MRGLCLGVENDDRDGLLLRGLLRAGRLRRKREAEQQCGCGLRVSWSDSVWMNHGRRSRAMMLGLT